MKITKSELKQMIREALREELAKKPLKEAYEFSEREIQLNQILHEYDDFKLEYDGYSSEESTDHWNWGSPYGHYQTSSTYYHDDFTYKVEAGDIFDCIRDEILSKKINDTSITNDLVAEYKRLYLASKDETDITEADIYLAQNLEEFAEIFMADVLDYFSDRAYEWADEHWD